VGTGAGIHVRRPLRGAGTARRRPVGFHGGSSSLGGGAYLFLALPSADRWARWACQLPAFIQLTMDG